MPLKDPSCSLMRPLHLFRPIASLKEEKCRHDRVPDGWAREGAGWVMAYRTCFFGLSSQGTSSLCDYSGKTLSEASIS